MVMKNLSKYDIKFYSGICLRRTSLQYQPTNQLTNQLINQSVLTNQPTNQQASMEFEKKKYLAMRLVSLLKGFDNLFHGDIQSHQPQHHTKQH